MAHHRDCNDQVFAVAGCPSFEVDMGGMSTTTPSWLSFILEPVEVLATYIASQYDVDELRSRSSFFATCPLWLACRMLANVARTRVEVAWLRITWRLFERVVALGGKAPATPASSLFVDRPDDGEVPVTCLLTLLT
jgi:hypothetical protein